MSDRPPPTPLRPTTSRPPSREGLKNVSRTLDELTSDHGPIIQLVKEVRRGNELAVSNQRSLRATLVALLLLFLGVFYSLYLVNRTTSSVGLLQAQQTAFALEQRTFAKEVAEKLLATQTAVDNAPKIVANDQGELVVMASVRQDPGASKAEAPVPKTKAASSKVKKRKRSKKSAMRVVDDLLADVAARAPGDSKPKAPAKQMIAIPLNTDGASYEAP